VDGPAAAFFLLVVFFRVFVVFRVDPGFRFFLAAVFRAARR